MAVTFGAGQFVAVGVHYDVPSLPDTGPVAHQGWVWLSPDGESWEALPNQPNFEGASFSGLISARDGSVVAFGRIDSDLGPSLQAPGEAATWRSVDGRTWERVDVGLPAGLFVTGAAQGARGYLLVGGVLQEGAPSQLWLSADGLHWELVYVPTSFPWWHIAYIGAGDEGFVALLPGAGDSAMAIASADGRAWFDGETLVGYGPLAAIGGDWITTATTLVEPPADIPVLFSANGLVWEEAARISDPKHEDFGYAYELISVGGMALLSAARYACCGPVAIPGGVWSSRDGRQWKLTDIRPDGLVAAGTEHDGKVVLAGHVGVSVVRVTIWLGAAQE